ncbi:unnamed protein product [Prunus armeniaca]|uniref:Uncharacterized protein n=1 Tax=Prunus armeniaca TaxID=36596 RepID=A0A6J5VEY1_PRUAR|nr:unnamed protein product [Prunus armeniaca]
MPEFVSSTAAVMPEFVFSAGVGGSLKDGLIASEKRARTQEMLNVGGLESDEPSPPLPPIPMSFKDKVSGILNVGGLESDEPSPPLPPIPMSFKDKVSGILVWWRIKWCLAMMML